MSACVQVALINEASQRWAPVGQSTGHVDDITAIAVRLPLLPDAAARKKGASSEAERDDSPYLQVPDGPQLDPLALPPAGAPEESSHA